MITVIMELNKIVLIHIEFKSYFKKYIYHHIATLVDSTCNLHRNIYNKII